MQRRLARTTRRLRPPYVFPVSGTRPSVPTEPVSATATPTLTNSAPTTITAANEFGATPLVDTLVPLDQPHARQEQAL